MQDLNIEGFAPEFACEVEEIVDHFNGNHADTVLFIARFAGGAAEAAAAEIAGLSPGGLTLTAVDGSGGSTRVPLDFAQPAVSLEQLQAGMMGLLARSRQAAGDAAPPTSIERELESTKKLSTFVTRVARVREVTPHLRGITFAGGLEGFRPIGPDQFVYVMVPRPGQGETIHDGVTMAELRAAPASQRPAAAYYTVRSFRPQTGELDVWFVLHDQQDGVSGWAESAAPGDRAALWGPRTAFEPPAGTSELLLVGDETGLPAIAAILEYTELPARVVVETVDASHVVPLVPQSPKTSIGWVFRGATPPQESKALQDGVRCALPAWRDGLYAFGAAESSRVVPVRRYLRTLGALPGQMHLTAYWRHGRALNA